jgi:4-diphosphocytidyl-2-C-methyl-D-erythritol kinase
MDRLAEFSASIGSDVPFFFTSAAGGSVAAICRGRGEQVEPVGGTPRLSYVIVRPRAGLSTADVYGAHRPPAEPLSIEPLLAAARARRTPAIAAQLANRLEEAARRVSPAVDELHQEFQRCHLRGHRMSGSGSSRFGVCRHDRHARRTAALLRGRRLGTVYRAATAPPT